VLRDDNGAQTVRFVLIELKSKTLDGDVIVLPPGEVAPPPKEPSPAAEVAALNARDLLIEEPRPVYVELPGGEDPALAAHLKGKSWSMSGTARHHDQKQQEVTQRDSLAVLVAIRVFDESANKLRACSVLAPEAYLRTGLLTAAKLTRRWTAAAATQPANTELPPSQFAEGASAFADVLSSLLGLGELINETPALANIVRPILPTPGVWAMITHPNEMFCLSVADPDMRTVPRPVEAPIKGLPVDLLSFMLRLFGDPSLECGLTVTHPAPPYHLCAGVLGVDCVQAKHPDRRLHMRLLAARRAPAASSPAEEAAPP
jgi:hypothetical protein